MSGAVPQLSRLPTCHAQRQIYILRVCGGGGVTILQSWNFELVNKWQWDYWGLKSSGMWHCVAGWVLPDFSNENCAFNFRVGRWKRSRTDPAACKHRRHLKPAAHFPAIMYIGTSWTTYPLDEGTVSFETSGTASHLRRQPLWEPQISPRSYVCFSYSFPDITSVQNCFIVWQLTSPVDKA